MRIGMVTACYKPVINGVTRMVALYKSYLEEAGHEVTVFTLGDPDPNGEEPGVVRSPALPLGDTGYYFSTRYTRAAQELLRQMDIIHCHHLFLSVDIAHRYGRCPIVYTNHTRYDLYTSTYIPLPQPAADALMRQIWPELTDLCDVVVTPSGSVRQVMLDFGVRRPIEVIENGVDMALFRRPAQPCRKSDLGIPETAVLLAYVGRLSPEKDVETLLTQFATARDVAPELHLLLVGKGPQAKSLVELADELGVREAVHFTGPVDYEAVPDYLAAADIFVTASVTEVHPLAVIEAMAAGLPVVAVAAPGVVDTVEPGVHGLLTHYAEGGLAAAMVALAVDPARRRRMSEAARRDSQRFDIRATVGKTLALYERLHEERPDLTRDREHGRGYRNWSRPEEIMEQLANLLRPPRQGP
ncbi:MAG: glycosyltransferase [Chloroflexi bacterium]|nr:glycosyltransferase [Chloroflexota bacterium]MCI0577076.1 glycosyltransferase [Chloroflexota bacterium]MCI0650158.1 glycosyltransferase [Chloroflexota bacterium]MCI0728013.1 glycosyltransferase [Chloroflexota bacterium]